LIKKKENPETIEQQKDFSFFTSSSKRPTSRRQQKNLVFALAKKKKVGQVLQINQYPNLMIHAR
jgi:hypothetical protein